MGEVIKLLDFKTISHKERDLPWKKVIIVLNFRGKTQKEKMKALGRSSGQTDQNPT